MVKKHEIKISNIPEISAIYFALLQCGYQFYKFERENAFIKQLNGFVGTLEVPRFFKGIKRPSCEVYPYWPRAAMLETAVFYLDSTSRCFSNYSEYQNRICKAAYITDNERGECFWEWLNEFPQALYRVMSSEAFSEYMKWEESWIQQVNLSHRDELDLIQCSISTCVEKYHSPVKELYILINPIKCVYSADYHLNEDRFIFSSGRFSTTSVLHEFFHHVVHPVVQSKREEIVRTDRWFPDLDQSYYLDGSLSGWLNALEEHVVRCLTDAAVQGVFPENLDEFVCSCI